MPKVTIAGTDRTDELRRSFSPELQRMAATGRFLSLPAEVNALRLCDARDARDMARTFVSLLRHRNHVDTRAFEIPRRPGLRGATMRLLKGGLWRLLRYQHDRIAFRQNLINSHVTSALEFQHEIFDRDIRRLQERVQALERALESIGGRTIPPPGS